MSSERAALLALFLMSAGCFAEELPEQNLTGQVIVPGDAVDDGSAIGMVYLGVYRGWNPEQLGYSYPTTAPLVGDNPLGDAQPYGGTTIGEYAYPCLRAIQCDIITGRYESIEQLLTSHPIQTESGELMTDEEYYDQCSWYYGWNSLAEFRFIGAEQLDFKRNDAGDWAADFLAWHTQVPAGSVVWGFVDNDFTSCTTAAGGINKRRSDDGQFFREGTNYADVLNFPDKYITEGDLVSGQPVTIVEGQIDGYELRLDEVIR